MKEQHKHNPVGSKRIRKAYKATHGAKRWGTLRSAKAPYAVAVKWFRNLIAGVRR